MTAPAPARPLSRAGIARRTGKFPDGRLWHSYKVDGLKVPGVTTITGFFKSGGLAEWPAKQTREYAVNHWSELSELGAADRLERLADARWGDRDAAAGRGTEVHRLGALIAAQGEEDEPVEVPPELDDYVTSYVDFLDQLEPKLAAPPELVVGNRTERYCGTADLLVDLPPIPYEGELIPAGRWLLDVKTSRSGIFGETALQVTGYERAEVFLAGPGDERPMEWLGIEHAGALHIRRDGWDLYPLEHGDDVWEHFVMLARLYHQQDAKKDWVGAAAGPFTGPAGPADGPPSSS